MVKRAVRGIAISKFKTTGLAVLEGVRTSGAPVLETRHGQPVAQIVPPDRSKAPRRKLGQMAGTGHILDDLIEPAFAESDWDAMR